MTQSTPGLSPIVPPPIWLSPAIGHAATSPETCCQTMSALASPLTSSTPCTSHPGSAAPLRARGNCQHFLLRGLHCRVAVTVLVVSQFMASSAVGNLARRHASCRSTCKLFDRCRYYCHFLRLTTCHQGTQARQAGRRVTTSRTRSGNLILHFDYQAMESLTYAATQFARAHARAATFCASFCRVRAC